MNDDQVLEFLRRRGRAEPPQDFIGSVLEAIADAPQRRASWFAPFLPAAAAIGAVAAVMAGVLIFANDPVIGPSPVPSPSASVQEEPGEVLLEEGDVVVMPAVDAEGAYGTITIERGQTRESYEGWETGNPWGASFVELHVEYAIDRPSVSPYGSVSFGITSDAIVDGQEISDRVYFGSVRPLGGPEPLLPNMLSGDDPISGWVVMEIPDEFPGAAVDLVHSLRTEDLGPIEWRVPLRLPDGAVVPEFSSTGDDLIEVGDVVEMPATDDLGEWGTIRLERGEEKPPSDSGWSSYEEGSVLIEIFVSYTAERSTEQSFGLLDWGLRIQDGLDLPPARRDPERPAGESLTDHASASEGSVAAGWIVLEVPVVEERSGVFLTYQGGERPGGPISTPLWEVLVRERHRNAPPVEGAALLQSGDATLLPAVDAGGRYGTITLDRGDDVGGYPLVLDPSSQTHFFIEIYATYELDRDPTGTEFGEIDWRVEDEDGAVVAELLNAFPPVRGRNGLGQWPGATVIEPLYRGWLIFAVPRDAADANLELVYQPTGVPDATRIPVRGPGEAPAPVAAEWPYQEPVYVAQAGLPFTVVESAEADALFIDADTCTNPEGGYTVSYPDSWYTNTALDNVPACSWFSPSFYELNESGDIPEEIAMRIDVFDGAVGFIWVDLYSEEIALDGVGGRRAETGMTKDPAMPTDTFQYDYLARLDADTEGRKLWAFTGTDYGGDYELNKAVLDRIMASLEFTD